MESRAVSDIVADLRSVGLSREAVPRLPNGVRPSADTLDRWARVAALGESEARQAAIWAIRDLTPSITSCVIANGLKTKFV